MTKDQKLLEITVMTLEVGLVDRVELEFTAMTLRSRAGGGGSVVHDTPWYIYVHHGRYAVLP